VIKHNPLIPKIEKTKILIFRAAGSRFSELNNTSDGRAAEPLCANLERRINITKKLTAERITPEKIKIEGNFSLVILGVSFWV
jgi:hypothetical protein